MKEISTEIIINAPIEKVWSLLIDFNSYKNWNPFIVDIQGYAKLDERLIISIKPSGKKNMIFKPKIISLKEKSELSWLGNLIIPGIYDGQHSFILENLKDNKVLFKHYERFTGILSKPIFQLTQESTQLGFEQMNEALKKQCEL